MPFSAERTAWLGVARTGSAASNGSGDYAIAFSTATQVRVHANDKALTRKIELLTNEAMSPLFLAAIEATEEAVYNSMFRATTMSGNGHTVEALPIEKTKEILQILGHEVGVSVRLCLQPLGETVDVPGLGAERSRDVFEGFC